jgi:hypothetical protein
LIYGFGRAIVQNTEAWDRRHDRFGDQIGLTGLLGALTAVFMPLTCLDPKPTWPDDAAIFSMLGVLFAWLLQLGTRSRP